MVARMVASASRRPAAGLFLLRVDEFCSLLYGGAMAHTVTYEINGEERTVEATDSMEALRAARTALSHGAPECFIVDDTGFRFRLRNGNELAEA